MRTNIDLDAAFDELVRAADAAFPGTRAPATGHRPRTFHRRWMLMATVAVAVVALSVSLGLRAWAGSDRHSTPTAGTTGLAPAGAFAGHWVSVDVVDGSAQTFDVSGSGTGGTVATRLHDTVATVACGGGPADAQGPGRLAGSQLFVTFTVSCPGNGRPPIRGRTGSAVYSYNSSSDTLTDDSGNVWHRA